MAGRVRNISLAAAREISRPWLAISSAEEITLRLSIPDASKVLEPFGTE